MDMSTLPKRRTFQRIGQPSEALFPTKRGGDGAKLSRDHPYLRTR